MDEEINMAEVITETFNGTDAPEFFDIRRARHKAFRWLPGVAFDGLVEKRELLPNGEQKIWAVLDAIINPGDWIIIPPDDPAFSCTPEMFKKKWEIING